MADFAPTLPLAVAFSGGADSTALLLACVHKWPGQVLALHVHHGLQAVADDFVAHCQRICDQLDVPLWVKKVDAKAAAGQSPEDAARRARYKAFEALAHENKAQVAIQSIAIAQHADDQVETLLLALSRGAGLPGLSAMAQTWQRAGVVYHRPFLRVSGVDVRAWLADQGVPFVTDPTNVDERYTRNRIRAQVLPALQRCFPQFRDTFARSCRHAAQAQELLTEVAAFDLQQVGVPPRIRALQTLSPARQANVLRHWLQSCYQCALTAAQLDELMHQIAACQTRGHAVHLKVADGFCERRGACLHWYNPKLLTSNPSHNVPDCS